MRLQRLLQPAAGIVLLGAALALAAFPGTREPSRQDREMPRVTVAEVTEIAPIRTARAPGTIRSARRATLAFVVSARVAGRPVQVGDRVHQGQLLASLEDRELSLAALEAEASLTELEMRLGQARRDRQRAQRLSRAEAATPEELERAEASEAALIAARDAAALRRDDMQRRLSETALYAPFSGTITAVGIEPGEWAAAGQPVLDISGDGELEVEIVLPETLIAGLSSGQALTVELPLAGKQKATGRLVTVGSTVSQAGRLYPALVRLDPHPAARAGMSAEVELTLSNDPRLAVPIAAIINPGSGRPAIVRINQGRAEHLYVSLGALSNDLVIVEAAADESSHSNLSTPRMPLAAGDLIALTGQTRLADGDRVEVAS